MNIELRNVKYAAFASQETSCFSAAIYIDGKHAGHVENDGHGGPDRISPRELEDRLVAHCKTLPPVKSQYGDLDASPDLLIGDLLDEVLVARDLKRRMTSKVVYIHGGKLYETKKVQKEIMSRVMADSALMARFMAKLNPEIILNMLPFTEAVALMRKHGG